MNDSKSSAPSRVIHDPVAANSGLSVVTPPNAVGHTYIASNPFSTFITRGKPNPLSTGTVTSLQQISVTANPVNAQYQVPLITCLNKNPLTVMTSFATKPSSTSGVTTVEKHSLTGINNSTSDSLTRPTVKPIGIQKVSYGKPPSAPTPGQAMSAAEPSPTQPGMVITQMKKDPVKPVLIGAGLRQPTKNPHFHSQISKTGVGVTEPTNIARNQPNNSNSWLVHQHDSSKPSSTSTVTASVQRKPPVMIRSVYHADNTTGVQSLQSTTTPEPGKKLSSVPHQPKTTFSISMPSLSHITEGQKPVYQLISPTFSNQSNPVKKIQTMIVTPVSNSAAVTTGFPLTTSTVISTGQITVMTCGYGVTNVPAPTPPSVSNSIPVAKVYPQQQLNTPTARLSATSTSSSRLSLPVALSTSTLPSASNLTIPRSTSNVLQPGTVKATSATSTVMVTPTTIVSSLPISGSRAVANSVGLNQVLCWPNIFPTYTAHPLPVVPSTNAMANLRPGLTLTNSQNYQSSGTIRVEHPGVVVVENPRPPSIQPSGASNNSILQQVPDGSSRTVPVSNSSGPTTPTMSPKPAILRRQRPDNSSVLKKLSFPTSSLASNQRRDHATAQLKAGDKRMSSSPYHTSHAKICNTGGSMKTNDVAVMIQSSDNKEVKPVLPNQVYGKQIIANNSFPSLKVNNVKASTPFTGGGGNKESNTQSYSIHPVNIDMKVKVEPGVASYHQVKTDSASASQVLYQYQHLLPTEAPQPVKHRIVTQASGQHIKTNTIFASPGSFIPQHHVGQTNGRVKPIKHPILPGSGSQYSIQVDAQVVQNNYTSSSINSFVYSPHSIQQADASIVNKKDKHSHLKTQSIKMAGQGENTTVTNHNKEMVKVTESPSRLWTQVKDSESMVGLSPRKRPRKQTHVVSEVSDVEMMVNEESTDDADEWEDETYNTSNTNYNKNEVSGTPSSRLPGHKSSLTSHSVKSESVMSDKKTVKEEKNSCHLTFKTDSSTPRENEMKTLTEFIDNNGVRYVATKKRPLVAVLNKLKPNGRSISNHFMHYSDVKVRDKKLSASDFVADRKRLKGLKVAMFALQLKQLVVCEEDVWKRMEAVYSGLMKHKQTFLEDTTSIALDEPMRRSSVASPSPCTPTSNSNSFSKALLTPTSVISTVPSTITENGLTPTTPTDRRVHKLKDEITKIEELAQANIQRCKVVSDQTKDTRTMLLKSIDYRQLACSILDGSTGHRSATATGPSNTLKRATKKKTIS